MSQVISIASHNGWSAEETAQLWQEVRTCTSDSLPLRVAFDNMAVKTGRKSNSIRNHYYAAIKSGEAPNDVPTGRAAPFVPFSDEEIDSLLRSILTAQGQGISVRACVSSLSGGNRALALRLQNKYRALLKSHPDRVMHIVRALQEEGLPVIDPYRRMRALPHDSALYRSSTDHIVRHLLLRTEDMSPDLSKQYLSVCLTLADLLTAPQTHSQM